MALQLKDLEARADYTDELIMTLQRTLDQLKAQGAGDSLSNGDRQYITKKLKAIRAQVVQEEQQIEDQQKIIRNYETTLGAVKAKVKHELLNIRKQLLVESARANPQEFRDEVAKRLREIRQEIVSQQSASGGASGDMIPPQIAAKIVTDLKKIRADVLQKEKDETNFRAEVKRRLIALRKDVVKIESENERLKAGGDKVPPRLQAILVRKLKDIKTDVFNLEAENLRLKTANEPDPLNDLDTSKVFTVVDMHCGGEPLRIVETGVPQLEGATLLQKRKYFQENLDDYRQALMLEPRGHADMYGAVLTDADEKECDFGVIFLNNDGYSTSCGHAMLCLGRYAVDFGKVKVDARDATTTVRIQAPCGVVEVIVSLDGGKSNGEVRYVSSPSWVEGTQDVATPSGNVAVDLAYGGTYYAVVPSTRYNLNIDVRNARALMEEGDRLNRELRSKLRFTNPDADDLAFLYGTIFTDGNKNLTVFAERQVDRCPTGSGIQAILALEFANNRIELNTDKEFVSVTGGVMYGSVVEELEYKGKRAVRVGIRGTSRYTGRSTLYVETNDETRSGFNLR